MRSRYPPAPEDAERLPKLSGAPEAAFSTYHMHAVVDQDHRKDLIKVLDQVPDIDWLQAIIENALRSADQYCEALESLLESDAHMCVLTAGREGLQGRSFVSGLWRGVRLSQASSGS